MRAEERSCFREADHLEDHSWMLEEADEEWE